MLLLEFHPLIEADLRESAEWYERQQKGLGGRFLDEAHEILKRLPSDFNLFSLRLADIRRANFRSFPHAIFFFNTGQAIVVLAILHGYRDLRAELQRRRESYD